MFGRVIRFVIVLMLVFPVTVIAMRYIGGDTPQPLIAYYVQDEQMLYAIRIVDLHHGSYQDIPVLGNPRPLQWSSDGQYLYFSDFTSTLRTEDIYRYSIQDSTRQVLTDDAEPEFAPILSPDSMWLLYLAGEQLLLRDLRSESTNIIQRFYSPPFDIGDFAAWSPDSQRIMYQFDGLLYLYDIKTEENYAINKAATIGRFLQWSDDSRRLWYLEASGNANQRIVEMTMPDGKFDSVHTIDRRARFIITPDGEQVAYNTYGARGSTAEVVVWDSATQAQTESLATHNSLLFDMPIMWLNDNELLFTRRIVLNSQNDAFPLSLFMVNRHQPDKLIHLANVYDYTPHRTFALWFPQD